MARILGFTCRLRIYEHDLHIAHKKEDRLMKYFARLIFCSLFLFCTIGVHAQDEDKPKDAEGCKDSPIVSRFPGGIINSCENKEFDQADFPLGNDKDGNARQKHLEGEFHSWDIATRAGTSEIQVFRNFQTALKAGASRLTMRIRPVILSDTK